MEYQTWESVPLEVMSDMISRKIITGDKAMVAQVMSLITSSGTDSQVWK